MVIKMNSFQIQILLVLALLLTACSGAAQVPQAAVTPATGSELPTRSAPDNPNTTTPPITSTDDGGEDHGDTPIDTESPGETDSGELFFLRDGTLLALDMTTREQRQLTDDVREFAAAPDGRSLALVRGTGRATELWQVARDGNSLVQLTSNTRVEQSISWSRDGTVLAYASADTETQPLRPATIAEWSPWCSASEVRLLDIATLSETTLEPGCDPAFSPDGMRIAFATPPTADVREDIAGPDAANTIRLVNRQGENGWSFAVADGTPETSEGSNNGLLVYAPAWSLDSTRLAYHRFMGGQTPTNVSYLEIAPSTQGGGELFGYGAGWLPAPHFSPDGTSITMLEAAVASSTGLNDGYGLWQTRVLQLDTAGHITLPDGERETAATIVDHLPMVTSTAWAPDSIMLAIVLPTGWSVDAREQVDAEQFQTTAAGDVWLWAPGKAPTEMLMQEVDYASPLLWLPSASATPAAQREPRSFPTPATSSADNPEQTGTATDGDILFLREATLTAYNVSTRQEQEIATEVHDFTATPDGEQLALVRTTGGTPEVWIASRDGTDLRQLTSNTRIEWSLSLSRDGATLVYASADAAAAPQERLMQPDWETWAAWCGASDIRVLDVTSGVETALEAGCQPALSRDGLRIAFATPPSIMEDTVSTTTRLTNNALRLVNRQGENGWDFTTSSSAQDGATDEVGSGKLVYAPVFSPDSKQLAYQRFLGYQALVDINLTEMGNSFEGGNSLLGVGAGWMQPAHFAPNSERVVIIEHNYSDARNYSGYDVWRLQLLDLTKQGEVILPTGTYQTRSTIVDELPRATGAAWAPDSSHLAVALPAGWSADISIEEPVFSSATPGDLWLWGSGDAPAQRLVEGVDFASPLLWLPPL